MWCGGKLVLPLWCFTAMYLIGGCKRPPVKYTIAFALFLHTTIHHLHILNNHKPGAVRGPLMDVSCC